MSGPGKSVVLNSSDGKLSVAVDAGALAMIVNGNRNKKKKQILKTEQTDCLPGGKNFSEEVGTMIKVVGKHQA